MDYPHDHILHIILHQFHKGTSKSKAVEKICKTYGPGSVDEPECKFWYERFEAGDFSLKDENDARKSLKPKFDEKEDEAEAGKRKLGKKKEIWIASEVLCKLLEWVPLKQLPSVSMVSRRYWKCSDWELDNRERGISMKIVTKVDDIIKELYHRAYIGKHGVWKRIKLTEFEHEPPKKFTIREFHLTNPCIPFNMCIPFNIPLELSPKTLEFLRKFKQHFVGADLAVIYGYKKVDQLLSPFFDRCSRIKFLSVKGRYYPEGFFAQESILNCPSLLIQYTGAGFDPMSFFDWLHAPIGQNPYTNQRQLHFEFFYINHGLLDFDLFVKTPEFLDQLKKKFEEDETKSKFIIQIHPYFSPREFTMFRLKNALTKEVLFSRNINGHMFNMVEFVRCPIEDESTIEFQGPPEDAPLVYFD